MSCKLTCPSCDRHTSALFLAYENGDPCPYCNASLATAGAEFYRQLPDYRSLLPPTSDTPPNTHQ